MEGGAEEEEGGSQHLMVSWGPEERRRRGALRDGLPGEAAQAASAGPSGEQVKGPPRGEGPLLLESKRYSFPQRTLGLSQRPGTSHGPRRRALGGMKWQEAQVWGRPSRAGPVCDLLPEGPRV